MASALLTALAACLLLGLTVVIMTKQRAPARRVTASFALVLLAGIEVADLLSLQGPLDPVRARLAAQVLESLLPAALLVLGLTVGRARPLKDASLFWKTVVFSTVLFPASVLLLPGDSLFYAPDLRLEGVIFLGDGGYWFYVGVLLACVVALALVEATVASTSGKDRWKFKFEAIGWMAALAVLVFYYSQGLLYRTIDLNLAPLRSGVIVIAVLLIAYSRFVRAGSVQIAVSRHVLYRSATLLVVGAYFLAIGLVGEGMRYVEAPAGRSLALFLVFAGGVGLLAILFSERARRRVKVAISKHFFAHKHDYRQAWLTFTGRLSTCDTREEIQDAVLATYTETFGLGGAALYLLDCPGRSYACAVRLRMNGNDAVLPADTGLIEYFGRDRVFDPYGTEYVPAPEEESFVRQTGARLIVPLSGNGEVAGFVVFGNQIVPEDFTYEDYDLMKVIARQAAAALINTRLSEELAETREMAALARISSFVIHDLKNLASSLSLVADNAARHLDDPSFRDDMMRTLRSTTDRMKTLISRLNSMPGKRSLRPEPVDLSLLCRETVEELKKMNPAVPVECRGSSAAAVADREELRKVMLNLILNALEALNGSGSVTVETGKDGAGTFVSVKDTGCGMTEEFMRQHLWKPFRTTKQHGLGIGLYHCRQIVEALGGSLQARSEPGKGSLFTLRLSPLDDAASAA